MTRISFVGMMCAERMPGSRTWIGNGLVRLRASMREAQV